MREFVFGIWFVVALSFFLGLINIYLLAGVTLSTFSIFLLT